MVKPTILIILLISIVGFIFCKNCYFTSPKFNKSNGYHTFLNSASYGSGIFIISFLGYWYFQPKLEDAFFIGFLSKCLLEIFRDLAPSIHTPLWFLNFIQVSIVALALSFILPFLFLLIAMLITWSTPMEVRRGAFKKISETDDTPEFSTIYFTSNEKGHPIAFTLSNRKVYVGYAVHGAKHLNDIMILPFKSGYRCDDELRLELITDYEPIFEYIMNSEDLDVGKFLVSIPIREIVHASLHDFGYKELFKKHEVPKKEEKMPNFLSRILK